MLSVRGDGGGTGSVWLSSFTDSDCWVEATFCCSLNEQQQQHYSTITLECPFRQSLASLKVNPRHPKTWLYPYTALVAVTADLAGLPEWALIWPLCEQLVGKATSFRGDLIIEHILSPYRPLKFSLLYYMGSSYGLMEIIYLPCVALIVFCRWSGSHSLW